MANKEIKGLDTFNFIPNYLETPEENEKRYREEYKKYFGEYPKQNKA